MCLFRQHPHNLQDIGFCQPDLKQPWGINKLMIQPENDMEDKKSNSPYGRVIRTPLKEMNTVSTKADSSPSISVLSFETGLPERKKRRVVQSNLEKIHIMFESMFSFIRKSLF